MGKLRLAGLVQGDGWLSNPLGALISHSGKQTAGFIKLFPPSSRRFKIQLFFFFYPGWDSNPQSLAQEANALSIRPPGLTKDVLRQSQTSLSLTFPRVRTASRLQLALILVLLTTKRDRCIRSDPARPRAPGDPRETAHELRCLDWDTILAQGTQGLGIKSRTSSFPLLLGESTSRENQHQEGVRQAKCGREGERGHSRELGESVGHDLHSPLHVASQTKSVSQSQIYVVFSRPQWSQVFVLRTLRDGSVYAHLAQCVECGTVISESPAFTLLSEDGYSFPLRRYLSLWLPEVGSGEARAELDEGSQKVQTSSYKEVLEMQCTT